MAGLPATDITLQSLRDTVDEVAAVLRRRWALYIVLPVVVGGSLSVAIFTGSAAHEDASEPAAVRQKTTSLSADSTAASAPGNSASASVTSNVSATNGSATASNQTDVTVNGQKMEVPANGSAHTDLNTADTNTSVDITHTSTGTTNSSLHVSVQSSSNAEGQ